MEEPRPTSARTQSDEIVDSHNANGDRATLHAHKQIFQVIAEIAQGNLNFRLNGDHESLEGEDRELLVNIDGLARRLRYIVGRLQRAADSIEAVVGEVLRGTQAVSSSVIDEATSVEKTSLSISEINFSMLSIGGSLQTLATLAQTTSSSIVQMAASIKQVSHNSDDLAQFSEETAAAIEEMAATVRKVAESSEALAASAEKTAGAMAAIDASTRSIDESVKDSMVLAQGVARSADKGSQIVAETASSMSKIKDAIDAATETIARLGKRSEQIGEVTHVINEIADRTQLLALNAAILAAQAGTQGRGFRIVADEIKELAERTAASTREIEAMIKAVREDVVETIERVAVGGVRAEEGVDLASRASTLLSEIREKTNATSNRIGLIADATAVQAAESHTVLEAADLVRQQARDIERTTNEQAETSRQIGERALHMRELTKQVRRATGEQAQSSRRIAEAMEELTLAVGQISIASEEQSAGVGQVLHAIETIKEVVRRNRVSISGISSAVDLLVREAELLNREVEAFELPTPVRGGHLRFALRSSQIALDPITASSISRIEVISNIFEGLVQFGERAELRPAIAERWETSPDGRAYTFTLRESARFHNGRRVRAEDVKYSFERQMRQNEDAAAWVFRPIAGAQEFIAGEADTVAGIQIISEHKIQIELIRPVTFFLSTLCMDYAFIVPREEVERSTLDFASRPVGSGPFRVSGPVVGREVLMERFQDYWNPELPYVDRLTVTFGASAEEIYDAFLRGALDYVSDLPLTSFADLRARTEEVHTLEAMQLQTRILMFDCERPPFSERRVRQAVCYAINREQFVQNVYGGLAEIAHGPIPPGLLGYDASESGYQFEVARARSLMEEAGYGSGFETEIWWPDSTNNTVECLKEDLAAIGIRAHFRYVSPEDMRRALKMRVVPIAGRDWYADYPDPDNFTYVLFHSRNRDLFTSTYSSEEVDHLTTQARSMADREQREEVYRVVTKLLLEDAPCAFLAHRRSFVAHRADLEGVVLHLLSPFISPKNLWFAKARK